MSSIQSNENQLPIRTFGVDDSALDDSETVHEPNAIRRALNRFSFATQHRPSFTSRWRDHLDEEHGGDSTSSPADRPPIPTMMQPVEVYATPLPVLSMIVLSITMLGEFLSANVSTPFLLFMVKGFGELTEEADIAFWTGILVATFFLTQFLTSLLWATVAEKHGRRAVLTASLLGSAVTCLAFGTATSIQQAICIRLMQGVFAGAVGVARGSVAFVTDPSNEGRAYAILGFCWGLGGVTGAIIGGSFERPAVKWPGIFKDVPIFVTYPYLLPCALAALVTFTGSVLSCFLSRDGGPRSGAIRLPPEKLDLPQPIQEEEEEDEETSPINAIPETESTGPVNIIRKKLSRRFSNYFAKRVPHPTTTPGSPSLQGAVAMSSSVPQQGRMRTFSRTSRANGSAYGYTGSFRPRLASDATIALTGRRGSTASALRYRRGSNLDSRRDSVGDASDLNFAQRLLMANENAVTNIADLWVAAAMNVDNDDPFESDTELENDGEADHAILDDLEEEDDLTDDRGRSISRPRRTTLEHNSPLGRDHHPSNAGSPQFAPRFGSPHASLQPPPRGGRHQSISFAQPEGTAMSRRPSSAVPSIFSHPGVKTPAAVLDAQQLLARVELDTPTGDPLAPILESHRMSRADAISEAGSVPEPPPSLASQLPILIIVQYGMLALHTTTHDQIFMSYLVSDYESGGLNLNAGHFAQLIALMCLAQIAYQFYLYPNMGPPRGRFSHLTMFRLGSILFVPAYLSVVLYRPLASAEDDGNFLLMTALVLSTTLRYCGITFGYTAISILLNYMTPPSAVGYANGIAQSIVSLARCVGPVIGGYLWSVSIQDHPQGYPLGFVVCAGVCAFSVFQSFLIR